MGCFSVPRSKRQAPGSPQSLSSWKDAGSTQSRELILNSTTSTSSSSSSTTSSFFHSPSIISTKFLAWRKPAKTARWSLTSTRSCPSPEPQLLPSDSRSTRLSTAGSAKDLAHLDEETEGEGEGEGEEEVLSSRGRTDVSSCTEAIESSSDPGPLQGPSLSTFCFSDHSRKHNSSSPATARLSDSSFGGEPYPLPRPAEDWEEFGNPLAIVPSLSPEVMNPISMNPISGNSAITRPVVLCLTDPLGLGSWISRRGTVMPMGGLPLPPPSVATKLLPSLEAYDFADLKNATHNFSSECCLEKGEFGAVYRAWMKDLSSGADVKTEMAVVRFASNGVQGFKEWKMEIQLLAQLPDTTNLSMVKGYCAHQDLSENGGNNNWECLLIFEQSPNGSLYDYLFGTRCNTLLDFGARINIVLGAARGLLYLHDRARLQIVYPELKASSVVLDKNYTPRLAGYGMTVISKSPVDTKSSFSMISQVHAKSNVWSFGVLLLELLTGKYSRAAMFFCDEKIFVHWAKPFMGDESRLLSILDPRIKGKCPIQGAMKVAALALECLRKKEVQRPSMSVVVKSLTSIKENYCSRFEWSDSALAMKKLVAYDHVLQSSTPERRVFNSCKNDYQLVACPSPSTSLQAV